MQKRSISRRNFAVGAAAAATAVFIQPDQALPQTAATEQEAPAMAQLSPPARAEVESKTAEIMRKYGSRLSPEQKTDLRRIMAETQAGLEKMRAFVLENGDEPATIFQIHRSEQK